MKNFVFLCNDFFFDAFGLFSVSLHFPCKVKWWKMGDGFIAILCFSKKETEKSLGQGF